MSDRLPDTLADATAAAPMKHFLDFALPVATHWRAVVASGVTAGAVCLAVTFAVKPVYTATAVFLPPQQSGGGAAALLSQLGSLAGLAGGAQKSPADQFVSLMQSVTVQDRMIDHFKLLEVYDQKFRDRARKDLRENSTMTVGRKDGLITVSVDDHDPQRAAQMANQYIAELRTMTATLAISEAQRRRKFFEGQLQQTKSNLTAAQTALQQSGISPGALKAEPRSAAEAYGRLRAELTATEVALATARSGLADSAPQVQALNARARAIQEQLQGMQATDDAATGSSDFIGRYREYKYQETLFELMAKQYELARIDESREGEPVQMVDPATAPEHKARPKRALLSIAAAFAGAALAVLYFIQRERFRASLVDAGNARRWGRFRQAWRR